MTAAAPVRIGVRNLRKTYGLGGRALHEVIERRVALDDENLSVAFDDPDDLRQRRCGVGWKFSLAGLEQNPRSAKLELLHRR